MKYIKHIFCLLTLFLVLSPAMAANQDKKGIDLKGILMGHIKDSYEWHITDFMGKHIILYLPVIVKSSTGWHVFCSDEFAHEPNEQGDRPVGILVILAYCLIVGARTQIIAFASMFSIYYLVMVIYDATYFSRVEKKNLINIKK